MTLNKYFVLKVFFVLGVLSSCVAQKKQEKNGKKVWEISHLLSPVLICKKILDVKTGELIEEEEF